jgi:hypothetical protein
LKTGIAVATDTATIATNEIKNFSGIITTAITTAITTGTTTAEANSKRKDIE